MKVKATRLGFYNHARRREGDVFVIADKPRRKVRKTEERQFEEIEDASTGAMRKILKRRFLPDPPEVHAVADKDGTVPEALGTWMEPVSAREPEKVSTSQQEIDRKTDEIKATNRAARGDATGSAEVI
jgi:hypothetical protein